jgi:hypothetical protein
MGLKQPAKPEKSNDKPSTEAVTGGKAAASDSTQSDNSDQSLGSGQADSNSGSEAHEGPSALKVADALDSAHQHQEVIDGKSTEAQPEIATAKPNDPAPEFAINQSDSSVVKQGTTESYTTGQEDHSNDIQTIDPMTGQGVSHAELERLTAERDEAKK